MMHNIARDVSTPPRFAPKEPTVAGAYGDLSTSLRYARHDIRLRWCGSYARSNRNHANKDTRRYRKVQLFHRRPDA